MGTARFSGSLRYSGKRAASYPISALRDKSASYECGRGDGARDSARNFDRNDLTVAVVWMGVTPEKRCRGIQVPVNLETQFRANLAHTFDNLAGRAPVGERLPALLPM